MFKNKIVKVISEEVRLSKREVEELVEVPPKLEMGDYAFPCFVLSKKMKKSPVEIASLLAGQISKKGVIERIENNRGYLNFFVDKKKLAREIIKINSNYGKINVGKGKKILIDFSGPNIGKPMHIGHIRSTIIGDSLMRVFEFLNYKTFGINYLGDVGLHIGKLIVAYEMWVDKDKLKKNPVAELLRLYVKFCGKEKSSIEEGVEEEFKNNEWTNRAKEKIKDIEMGDKKSLKVWDDIRKASGKGFDKIYEMLKVNFDETTGQSFFEERGKQLVINALEKGIAHREGDGAVYIEVGQGKKKYILRSNETASYITYDLGAVVEREKKHKFERLIYVVDFRQKEHFESLFLLIKLLGYDYADKLEHLAFGTVNFGNEIIATREGKVVLLDNVLKKTIEKASSEIKKRGRKGDAEKVGVGAVKYAVLKNEPVKDVNFSWDILNFEGNTGPYLQYSYARACSIIKKAGNFNASKSQVGELSDSEIKLMKIMGEFPNVVFRAGEFRNPSLIASYAFELAQSFNEFYHSCRVVDSSSEGFRLRLVESFRIVLGNALNLLGIEVMEEM